MVALEALSRGRPVVATAAGGLRDVVDDSVGWVLPDDPAGWPDTLRGITRAAVEERQQACLALYRQRFSPEVYRDRIVNVICGSHASD
jgi:glycosyltransferase involved in cell wall biosynthesis